MPIIPCTTPGCTGTREISKTAPNRSRIKELCKSCMAEYTRAYQKAWYAKHTHGKPRKKRGGYRPRRKAAPMPEDKKLNLDGKPIKWCKWCGRDAWPNWFRCPACHNARSRYLSGIDEHDMPHVPITR